MEKYSFWRRTRYKLRMRASDLRLRLDDLIKISRLRGSLLNSVISDQAGGWAGSENPRRWAIVAVHVNAMEFFSIRNLCQALASNDYRVMVVSSGPVPKELRQEMLSVCHRLVERIPLGRDFGSYKLGIDILQRSGLYSDLEDLVLCNDSMFWPGSLVGEIRRLNSSEAPWRALFEHCNTSSNYHAQSFFQAFSAEILGAERFMRFWDDYWPFTDREHAIKMGEIGLTKCLVESGRFPEVLYSAQAVIDDIVAMLRDRALPRAFWPALSICEPEFFQEFMKNFVCLKDVGCDSGPLSDWLEARLRAFLDDRMTLRNPTHGAGIILNVVYGAPIKRDICVRAGYSIGGVATLLTGFSPEERGLAFRALVNRGHRSQFGRYKSYLMDRGRM